MSPPTFEGILERESFGTGGWALRLADGRSFSLDGDVPTSLAGQRVRVAGDEVDSLGLSMSGPVLRVESIEPA